MTKEQEEQQQQTQALIDAVMQLRKRLLQLSGEPEDLELIDAAYDAVIKATLP